MSGGAFNHGVIYGNIYSALKDAIRASGAKCITLSSEVRMHIEKTNSIVYPDTMVRSFINTVILHHLGSIY